MRSVLVAVCALLSLPALAATPATAPAATPAAAGDSIDWDRQADVTVQALKPRLKLTDAQADRIRPQLAAYLPRLRAMFDSYAGESIESLPALLDQFRQARDAFKANLDPILNEEQRKEFMVIRGEVDAEIHKALVEARLHWFRTAIGLDEAQAERARPIIADNLDKRLRLMSMHADSQGNPTVAGRAMWPEIEKVQQETDTLLKGILTPRQMETYTAWRAKKGGAA